MSQDEFIDIDAHQVKDVWTIKRIRYDLAHDEWYSYVNIELKNDDIIWVISNACDADKFVERLTKYLK